MSQLRTKRTSIAHVSVCIGCCCGQVEKGHPEVPVAWLKAQWKARRLLKRVQLSISGCLGPCDLTNVASIGHADGAVWLGRLETLGHYEALVDWAQDVTARQRLLPLPPALNARAFERFEQTPGVTTLEER